MAICLLGALGCAALALIWARRYAFSRAGTIAWTAGVFLLGPAGLLTMLVIRVWPARERCPSCGRMRVVTRERCEHCAAAFPSPRADGTEILMI